MKKVLSLILLALLPIVASAYDACIDGIYYNFLGDDAKVTYRNINYNSYTGAVVIPASVTYNGKTYAVTSIGYYAFEGCSGLTSITIPNSVTSIENYAFQGCSGLTSVTIPNSVTSIGGSAFSGCSGLTSINVGTGNVTYDSRNNCNAIIETATNTLIAGCKNTVIPNSVTSIGYYAFEGCSGLTSVTIPNSVTSIDNNAFNGCSSLTSVTIPNSVISIGGGAFRDCRGLTSVTIGSGVTSIGGIYLYNEPKTGGGITGVTIVSGIGGHVFSGCSSLTSIKVEAGNNKYDSRNNCNAIIETASNTLVYGCMNTNIPKTVTKIGEHAFCQCTGLTSVSIPNSVTSIGQYAFKDCPELTDVYCYAENVPNAYGGSFYNSPIASATLHVPAGALEAYRTTAPWSNFGTIVAIEDDEVTATDVTAMSYAVYAQPAKARKGSQTTLNVCMKNTQPITLWQADLTLPSGFTLATDAYGDPMVSISGNRTSTSRHSISTSTLPDGSIRILCSSSSNKTFTGTDGEVATITLNVASNVTEGDYVVKFNNIKLVEADETKHEVDEVISTITVKNYTLGDVNDDGSIDGADLVGIVNYILDRPTSGNIFEAADVNLDGVIDGGDYVREVNAILGKVVLSARRKASKAEAAEADYAIYTSDLEDGADNQATLCLNMKNQQPVTLWQADLVLPDGVSIATDNFDDPMVYITGGRTTEARHAIATNTLPDSSIRILCSSSSNKTFTGNDGEVATITLNIDNNMESGEYPVALKNILIVEADETRHTCEPVEYTLNVTHTTGISPILTLPKEEQVYDLSGRRVDNSKFKNQNSRLPKGINIINGKKVLVK